MKLLQILAGLIVLIGFLGLTTPAVAATPDEVDKAITDAVKFLYSQQNNAGNWEGMQAQDLSRGPYDLSGGQWGGTTALATYALLAAGESPKQPQLAKAIDFLEKANINGTYALGLRCQIWRYLKDPDETHKMIFEEKKILLGQLQTKPPAMAMFDYLAGNTGRSDHSASQYGVLGLWAVDQLGGEISKNTWQMIESAWIADQMKQGADTGAWCYEKVERTGAPYNATLTTAGVASLFITQDALHGFEGLDCSGNVHNRGTIAIELGLKYITAHYDDIYTHFPYYSLYGIERIGAAGGYKYFGDIDWYKDGADWLIKHESGGNWPATPESAHGEATNTSFGLLFLVHGRGAVIVNKLNYAPPPTDPNAPAPPQPLAKNWDERPRDASNLAKWMTEDLERPLNWQIVTLKRPIEELHDSPILYIAGNQLLTFSDEDEAKLKLFIEQGGIIFGNADCASQVFSESFQRLGLKLTDNKYSWRILPPDHVIYTGEQFPADKWPVKMQLQGISNGARELMVLASVGDPSKDWQAGHYKGLEQNHQFLANLFLYGSEKDHIRVKGDNYIVTPDPAISTTTNIKVARLQFDGNWDPEPGGWRQLAAVMHNTQQTKLAVESVKLGEGKLTSGGYSAAHLTGTGPFKLTDLQRGEIKKFVNGGGTLIVDACGGNSEFADAAKSELETIFGSPAATELTRALGIFNPFFGTGEDKIKIAYRHFATKQLGAGNIPRLFAIHIGTRIGVFFSPEDLSVGLVGEPIDGIVGYEPQTATDLMIAMLNYPSGLKVKHPATQATTGKPSK